MKYKKYLVYSLFNVLGLWFMLVAQFSALNNFLPVDDKELTIRINQHEVRWIIGWAVVIGANTVFQSWYWSKEKRQINLSKPTTKKIMMRVEKRNR